MTRTWSFEDPEIVPEGAAEVQLWSFHPPAARTRLRAAAASRGVVLQLHPALKPALAVFRDLPARPGDRVRVDVPTAPDPQAPDRFRAELHPLADLLGVPVTVRLGAEAPPGPVTCRARLLRRGATVATAEALVPVRLRPSPAGPERLSACGWRRVRFADGRVTEGPWETPEETALFAALDWLCARCGPQGWHGPGPHFGRLTFRLEGPFADEPLGAGETLSPAEVLHEELYFGALEILAAAAGLPPGDRRLTPGQVVPDVVPAEGPLRLTVTLSDPAPAPAPAAPAPDLPAPELRALSSPPTAAAVHAALAALGGRPVAARSRQGRTLHGRLFDGDGPAVVLTGGQHANEPTGVVGALLAARALIAERARFGLCPLENPDGWALYHDLLRTHPGHMHHAARYTAAGADLAQVPGHEAEMRARLRAETRAGLHLSLHGYPAHEWLRPFTGYLPQGFADWRLPRGVFLILHAQPGWEGPGRAVLHAAAAALNADPLVTALNRAQSARLSRARPDLTLERVGDVPVLWDRAGTTPGAGALCPVTLITEAPDETVHGPRFRLLVRAQAAAALAAARVWRAVGRDAP